jgi:hypothetical protein
MRRREIESRRKRCGKRRSRKEIKRKGDEYEEMYVRKYRVIEDRQISRILFI